jgi:heat shock protein HslJ
MVAAGSRLALLALLVAGCTSIAADQRTFEGTEWQVTAIDGASLPSTENYRVQFRHGRIGGRFGCNMFSGTYQVRGANTLIVGPAEATEMACEGPAMDTEARGFRVLRQPMRLNWASSRRVTLTNKVGSIALDLIR